MNDWQPKRWGPTGLSPVLVRIGDHVMLKDRAEALVEYLNQHRWQDCAFQLWGRMPKRFR
jgi:hypothetical protein